jgi:hypothetical protein
MKKKKNAALAALKPTEISSAFYVQKTTPGPVTSAIAPAAAPKPAESNSAPTTVKPTPAAVTTIEVKMDVGMGNALYLRGQGSGLTWEHGVPLACVDGKTWRWSQTVAGPITFKVLLNDKVWSAGNDLVVAPGQKLEISPSFA